MMLRIDMEKYTDAQRYASQNLRWNNSTRRQRYRPAINLVLTVYWLHQNGYAIGDLSEQNTRVNDGNVTLIDCDSYSIEGSEFTGQMEAPRYTPPEGRGTTHARIRQTDRFGVAVHIFQFLMAGFHPYQAVGDAAVGGTLSETIEHGVFPYVQAHRQDIAPPPRAPEFAQLPEPIQATFSMCFSTGQHAPDARPSLQRWLAVLSEEGNFEINGLDLSDTTIEAELPQNVQNAPTNPGTAATEQMSSKPSDSAANSASETHWADELREESTTVYEKHQRQQSTGQGGKSTTGQQSTGQRGKPVSIYILYALVYIAAFSMMFMMIVIYFE